MVHGIRSPEDVTLAINGVDADPTLGYDQGGEVLTMREIMLKPTDELRLQLGVCSGTLLSGRDRRAEACRKLLRSFRLDTDVKRRLDLDLDGILDGRTSLMNYSTALTDAQLSALLHTVQR
jgi:hypothetical protein